MANTFRSVDARFWSDHFVRKLTSQEIYAFLYFLTSPHSSWCGIYELPLDVAAFEMKMDEKDLRNLLPKLYPKVIYVDEWVYLPNWVKYHTREDGTMSPQQKKGLENAFFKIPERIRLKIRELGQNGIPYTYPMGGDTAFAFAFTSAFNIHASPSASVTLEDKTKKMNKYHESEHSDSNEPIVSYETGEKLNSSPKKEPKNKIALKLQSHFIDSCEKNTGTRPVKDAKGYYMLIDGLRYLSEDQCRLKIDDWFGSGIPLEQMVSLTRCFSHNEINGFRVRNGIK